MLVHLVDGTYELFRYHFAVPSHVTVDGREVAATRGAVGTVLQILEEGGTHVGVATDHVIESFRNRLFAGYKTGEGIAPDLWAQFPLAEEAFVALGIVTWPMVEFEADDAIATAAVRFAAALDQIVILSPDKDLAQCVDGDRIVLHDRIRRTTYDEAAVRAKFGVPPAAIPDFLALVGDTADGIPGIPGWGAKSASAALAAYGRLDAIPDDPRQWSVAVRNRDRLAEALAQHRTEVDLYKTLATLRLDVPLVEGLEDLRWRGVPRRRYEAFCERLGLGDLSRRPTTWRDD
jgi:5'-3' exonuclease